MRASHLIRHHFLRSLFNKTAQYYWAAVVVKRNEKWFRPHEEKQFFAFVSLLWDPLNTFCQSLLSVTVVTKCPNLSDRLQRDLQKQVRGHKKVVNSLHICTFPYKVFLEYFQYFCSPLRNGALTPSYQAGYKLLILIMEEVDMCACDHFFAHV